MLRSLSSKEGKEINSTILYEICALGPVLDLNGTNFAQKSIVKDVMTLKKKLPLFLLQRLTNIFFLTLYSASLPLVATPDSAKICLIHSNVI